MLIGRDFQFVRWFVFRCSVTKDLGVYAGPYPAFKGHGLDLRLQQLTSPGEIFLILCEA